MKLLQLSIINYQLSIMDLLIESLAIENSLKIENCKLSIASGGIS